MLEVLAANVYPVDCAEELTAEGATRVFPDYIEPKNLKLYGIVFIAFEGAKDVSRLAFVAYRKKKPKSHLGVCYEHMVWPYGALRSSRAGLRFGLCGACLRLLPTACMA